MNVVAFDKLGLVFNINSVAFHIGAKEIYMYAIIILAGFLIAAFFCSRTAKKQGINPDYIYDIAIYGLIFGIICARIYYVLFDLKSFVDNPLDIFKIWEGGLAIYGGIIGGVLTAYVYCKIKKLNFLEIFDIFAPGLLIGQSVGRWGNFFNCEVYGGETASIFGMSINGGAPVHPLFLYESVWNLVGLVIILLLRNKKTAHGQVFFGYLFWYSLGRLFLEGMRQKQYILYVIDGVLGISQVVAFVCILSAILGFLFVTHRQINQKNR